MERRGGWPTGGRVVVMALIALAVVAGLRTVLSRYPPVERRPAVTALPLDVGTSWLYRYEPYVAADNDPRELVWSSYLMTETVTAVESIPPYRIVTVSRDFRLEAGPPTRLTLPAAQVWYVVAGKRIIESRRRPDPDRLPPEQGFVSVVLPLTTGTRWCAEPERALHPLRTQCQMAQRVEALGPYDAEAGRYEPCAYVTESVSSGGIARWFCQGVGLVAASYDHGGSRFGFRQTLLRATLPER